MDTTTLLGADEDTTARMRMHPLPVEIVEMKVVVTRRERKTRPLHDVSVRGPRARSMPRPQEEQEEAETTANATMLRGDVVPVKGEMKRGLAGSRKTRLLQGEGGAIRTGAMVMLVGVMVAADSKDL